MKQPNFAKSQRLAISQSAAAKSSPTDLAASNGYRAGETAQFFSPLKISNLDDAAATRIDTALDGPKNEGGLGQNKAIRGSGNDQKQSEMTTIDQSPALPSAPTSSSNVVQSQETRGTSGTSGQSGAGPSKHVTPGTYTASSSPRTQIVSLTQVQTQVSAPEEPLRRGPTTRCGTSNLLQHVKAQNCDSKLLQKDAQPLKDFPTLLQQRSVGFGPTNTDSITPHASPLFPLACTAVKQSEQAVVPGVGAFKARAGQPGSKFQKSTDLSFHPIGASQIMGDPEKTFVPTAPSRPKPEQFLQTLKNIHSSLQKIAPTVNSSLCSKVEASNLVSLTENLKSLCSHQQQPSQAMLHQMMNQAFRHPSPNGLPPHLIKWQPTSPFTFTSGIQDVRPIINRISTQMHSMPCESKEDKQSSDGRGSGQGGPKEKAQALVHNIVECKKVASQKGQISARPESKTFEGIPSNWHQTIKVRNQETMRVKLYFKCRHSRCGSIFKKSCNLRDHFRKHTGQRPFTCPKCKKTFTQSGNLGRHLKNVHGVPRESISFFKRQSKTLGAEDDQQWGGYDVAISDESEGSLLLMSCEEFSRRYPDIAESAHEHSFKASKTPKRASESNDIEMEESEDLIDESSSYRA